MISGILWTNYKKEVNDDPNDHNDEVCRINNNKMAKTNDKNILNTEFVAPLKYLSTFLKSLGLLLINCEAELDL